MLIKQKKSRSKNNSEKSHGWSDIKKILSRWSRGNLVAFIGELYSFSKLNQNFFETRFIKSDRAIIRYKELIKKYIAPRESWKSNQQISLKDAKKVLSDYKKATSDKMGLIDLMVCYVEYGNDFTNEFGDIDAAYYSSLESVFRNALKLMKNFQYQEVIGYVQRLKTVVKKAEGMGWGYYDAIAEMLHDAYPNN